ncbi:4-hydroxythreonine-4-phosphate dehydrogenase PdxA [Malaciobacter halophilus]|uniref:4-hydroxythreonine-4-phosphate dehydrogenase n=1 Tax=Malaciobacter halophilus TaxID=197482 RepID=A0A2N1J3F5_9BACT|nr:4-hydroxythreonine-4-phosphate dehydrogenase [Malaciobacter halophilus]AXH09172.1 4-hydroxy-L-threonine phosphate dehydrogenase, NAD-dependent [Malaciobacter halophilus]PKI81034.1 4-hydroxythreonine-4-phosphate dehydrogenase PdxA [Malaciobacter halophilus]
MRPKIAISIGDLNGIGIQIALQNHEKIKKLCKPIYCINKKMLNQAATLLNLHVPKDFEIFKTKGEFEIKAGQVSKKSGKYSYNSFIDAITLTKQKQTSAVVTLPINKESWNKAKIDFKGHTEVLRSYFGQNAIMMLGCKKMFVALYTEHIALKKVPKKIKEEELTTFLCDFYKNVKQDNIQVLGLNPHASDNGVLGNEEVEIFKAIKNANRILKKSIFKGPIVPDTAFSKANRKSCKYFVCMYHDQGLAPLKALYFDQSINVSLNLPIIRTSVDHGTAFDIAYKNKEVNSKSYINAVKEAVNLINTKV